MIVLSRKKNESLVINNDIIVTVVEIRGDKVRLGIEHPRDVPVHRQEVWAAIHRVDPPSVVSADRQPDKLDRLTAALQARLSVSVSRELVAGALREAGVELPITPTASASR